LITVNIMNVFKNKSILLNFSAVYSQEQAELHLFIPLFAIPEVEQLPLFFLPIKAKIKATTAMAITKTDKAKSSFIM